MSHWIQRCESALAGTPGEGVDVVRGTRPPLFDSTVVRALVTPVMAALFWAAETFRERMTADPLDALALLLRLLALTFTVRALLLAKELAARLRAWTQSDDHALVLCHEGLLVRTPRGDFAIPREDVLDVVEHGRWGERSGRRWADVYVVTRPESGRLHLALPPVFDATPGVLAERLMRWRGAVGIAPDAPDAPDPAKDDTPLLVSKLWDELRTGARPPGVAVVRHGSNWLWRGPWATVLLGAAVLEGWARLPSEPARATGAAAPLVALLCLVLVPLGWILWTRREIALRGGLALVLTPRELLVRTRAGVQRIPWSEIARIAIHARQAWTMLRGAHEARSLAFERKDDGPVVIAESFLGVPAEVALALGDAYRKHRVRAPP